MSILWGGWTSLAMGGRTTSHCTNGKDLYQDQRPALTRARKRRLSDSPVKAWNQPNQHIRQGKGIRHYIHRNRSTKPLLISRSKPSEFQGWPLKSRSLPLPARQDEPATSKQLLAKAITPRSDYHHNPQSSRTLEGRPAWQSPF